MKLVEGQLIHNRYRLDRRLAQGGMGEVWKGYDIQLNLVVAIKALRGDLSDVEAKRRRLRIEARNSADLAHPNIAALFDYYENDGIGFLIMEYVDSDSLADIYRKQGIVKPLELLPILVQVARGLYVAHSHGIIHRDVKPANIMVSEDGDVKITDFGVSTSTNQAQITQDGMVVGTAQYISPEQAQGKKATPQSDIYSLGVVAYEGLCGHRPFTGATPIDIAAAHVNDAVPPLPDTVDVQLAQFVMSMLSKDPRDRPADALVVSRTLSHIERRLMDQQATREETPMSRGGRAARRVVSMPFFADEEAQHNAIQESFAPRSVDIEHESQIQPENDESSHHSNDQIDGMGNASVASLTTGFVYPQVAQKVSGNMTDTTWQLDNLEVPRNLTQENAGEAAPANNRKEQQ
jgi:eukaryotic-like serine/threonine-protein kinase